ncbi:EPSP synthase (3-phosphoshikimate 1-carboxyvinyltransferase) [Fragilaria crotonensis]|nr:EPSP synthase (3-phosphoshikimate 1-carboxyvinyltransferase) [Fragilaria crotonensis]
MWEDAMSVNSAIWHPTLNKFGVAIDIEADMGSGATCLYHFQRSNPQIMSPGTILVEGDAKLQRVDVDCAEIPHAVMTLAVVALFTEGPTTIRNVYSWWWNETERMKATVGELVLCCRNIR